MDRRPPIAPAPPGGGSLDAESLEGLARLLVSETGDVAAWEAILSTAIAESRRRGVAPGVLLRTRRRQVALGGVWRYEGPAEVAPSWGGLFEEAGPASRWVRWASTRRPASSESRAAVTAFLAKGGPPSDWRATSFVEDASEADAERRERLLRARGRWATRRGRWVFYEPARGVV